MSWSRSAREQRAWAIRNRGGHVRDCSVCAGTGRRTCSLCYGGMVVWFGDAAWDCEGEDYPTYGCDGTAPCGACDGSGLEEVRVA